jgi:hypothetical protein
LALNLPVLIDGNFVFSGRLAVEHLSKRREDGDPTEITHDETLMLNHLDISLVLVYEQLVQILESGAEELKGKSTSKASVVSRIFGKIHNQVATAISKP